MRSIDVKEAYQMVASCMNLDQDLGRGGACNRVHDLDQNQTGTLWSTRRCSIHLAKPGVTIPFL